MPEIHVGLSERAYLSNIAANEGDRSLTLEMILPSAPEIVDYEVKQSPRFWLDAIGKLRGIGVAPIGTRTNPLMTPSAGAISFFLNEHGEREYVSLCQKDAGAPRDPGFRVPRNGFPSSQGDWYTFDHLYREAFEEGIFLTRDHELLLTGNPEYDATIEKTANNLVSHTGLSIRGTRTASITFSPGKDTVRVLSPDRTGSMSGVLSITPETGCNLIQFMDVRYPIEELLLVDGETFPNGKPICRDTCLIALRELQGKLFGDIVNERVYKHDKSGNISIEDRVAPFLCDKVPRSVLNQVEIDGKPVYPLDWMDESYEFLNSRAARMESAKIMYSTLEKKMKVKP